jgi:hypothetical protein
MKSISGANDRAGTVQTIGDNRYGDREYDDNAVKKMREYYRKGDEVYRTVKEVKNPLTQTVKTVKAR